MKRYKVVNVDKDKSMNENQQALYDYLIKQKKENVFVSPLTLIANLDVRFSVLHTQGEGYLEGTPEIIKTYGRTCENERYLVYEKIFSYCRTV